MVDRLLASPHFGERWAQHWLDVVRFAETNGFELDAERPHAWRYRDYVIEAFNDDKPYDRFVTEQLAGDELATGKDAARGRRPLGRHRLAPLRAGSHGQRESRPGRDPARTAHRDGQRRRLGVPRAHGRLRPLPRPQVRPVLGRAITTGCRRSSAPTQYADVEFATAAEERSGQKKAADDLNAKIAPLEAQIATIDAPYREADRQAKRAAARSRSIATALDTPGREAHAGAEASSRPTRSRCSKVTLGRDCSRRCRPADREKRADAARTDSRSRSAHAAAAAGRVGDPATTKPAETYVLKRGNPSRSCPRRARPSRASSFDRQRRRRAATRTREMDDAARPSADGPRDREPTLAAPFRPRASSARRTTSASAARRPTHPELLDWLATRTRRTQADGGAPWSLKHIHRLIVTSSDLPAVGHDRTGAKPIPTTSCSGR